MGEELRLESDLLAVDTKQVAKVVKRGGRFALADMPEGPYLFTSQFTLRLRAKDAFSIQCKLEVEKRNVTYQWDKTEGFVESDNADDDIDIYYRRQKYQEVIETAGELEQKHGTDAVLASTGLAYVGYGDKANEIWRLYKTDRGYMGLLQDHADMFSPFAVIVIAAEGYLAINRQHTVIPLTEAELKGKCPLLKR